MTISLKELLAQRQALEAQIQEARNAELATAVAQVRAIISEYELTVNQVFPSGRGAARALNSVKVAPKYRDPATGATWTGRGKPPAWIANKDREQFAIEQAQAV